MELDEAYKMIDRTDRIDELLALFSMRITEIESQEEIETRIQYKDNNGKVSGSVIIYPKKPGDGYYMIRVTPKKVCDILQRPKTWRR